MTTRQQTIYTTQTRQLNFLFFIARLKSVPSPVDNKLELGDSNNKPINP